MSAGRFWVKKSDWEEGGVWLRGREKMERVQKVLRKKEGEEVRCFDGEGREVRIELEKMGKGEIYGRIVEEWKNDEERGSEVWVCQALMKGVGKNELVVQKLTELGVRGVVFLQTERVEKGARYKEERLRKVMVQACEQCGRGSLVDLFGVKGLEEVFSGEGFGEGVWADEEEKKRFFCEEVGGLRGKKRVNFFVGPEGGWSEYERNFLLEKLGRGVSLGKNILRAETAGIAMVAGLYLGG